MSTYGQSNLKVEFDNTAGSLIDISAYVMEASGLKRTALLEETDAFGDSTVERSSVGVSDTDAITLSGIYDDSATGGPDAVFVGIGNTRTLKYTWGGSKTSSVETIIESYERKPTRKQLHKYTAVLQPTGSVTEA